MPEIDLAKIEAAVKAMRQELSDLSTQVDTLSNEKVGLIRSVGQLKRQQEVAKDAYDRIAKRRAEIEAEIADQRKTAQKEAHDARNEQIKAKAEQDQAQAGLKALEAEKQAIENKQAAHKENVRQHNANVAKLNQEKAALERSRQVNYDQQVKNEVREKELDNRDIDTAKKNSEATDNRMRSQKLEVQLNEKIDQTNKEKEKVENIRKLLEQQQQETENTRTVYEAKIKETAQAKAEAEAQKLSFQRQIAALDNREKEVRILELKVQKLIKEKNLSQELKKLEQSLKQ